MKKRLVDDDTFRKPTVVHTQQFKNPDIRAFISKPQHLRPRPQIDIEDSTQRLRDLNKRQIAVQKKQNDLKSVEFRSKNRLNGMLVKAKSPYLINA